MPIKNMAEFGTLFFQSVKQKVNMPVCHLTTSDA